MLLIAAMSLVFIFFLSITQKRALDRIIETKVESANLLAENILQQTTSRYQQRIKGFINYKSSRTKQQYVEAFAHHDQASLLHLTKPFLSIFQKENPYFHSLAWVLPDNTVFLRVQIPELSGDNITSFLPDVAEANSTRQQISGFGVAKFGMQYRIVEPVVYDGRHIGTVLFGIRASLFSDMLEKGLKVPSGLAVINEECKHATENNKPVLTTATHTVWASDAEVLKLLPENIDWNQQRHDFSKNGNHYILLNILSLRNYANKHLGNYFIVLDVTGERQAATRLLYASLATCCIFLLLSFIIIYFGYGSLVQKIVTLNQSLEKNNLELEERVRKRTAKLQESQQQLNRAQKMEAIGMMAGGVAHDLNNILSGIISYPELLLLQLPESSKLREPIKAIQDSGKRAATVVADLLTVARGAASTKELHDINLLIEEYMNSPECKKLNSLHPQVDCIKHLNAEHSIISCSPVHIKKTIMNLVTNAVEATGGSGEVVISTCNRQLGESENDMQPGEYLVLTVQDDGPGIAAGDLEHIFEPFYTRKVMGQSGTGLGLAIVWNTVQDHHGKIFVESNKEETRFTLYFPTSGENRIDLVENGELKDISGNNEHILVVDDEPQLRDIACQILRNLGYKVDSVCSGELAIQFVKDNPVDLIVLDMMMEPGMTGCQTYREILKLYPSQKAIITSGFSKSDDVKATLRLGASGFLRKPYLTVQLGKIVKKALCKKSTEN